MGPTVTMNVLVQRYWIWGALGCKLYGMIGAVCGNNAHVKHIHPKQHCQNFKATHIAKFIEVMRDSSLV